MYDSARGAAGAAGARTLGGAGVGLGVANGGAGGSTTAPASFRSSMRALGDYEGTLPRDWHGQASAASSQPSSPGAVARLVEVVGLDRGRLNFEGVILNSMCSLRRLGLRNVSGGTVVVRLGSTVGDQLRWQLRNDNLNVLREWIILSIALVRGQCTADSD